MIEPKAKAEQRKDIFIFERVGGSKYFILKEELKRDGKGE